MKNTLIVSITTFALATACGGTANDELLEAIPDRSEVEVALPEAMGSTSGGLEVGSTSSGLVGGPADYYTLTYHQARHLNNLGKHVIRLLEEITKFPATERTPGRAVWGPGSDEGDPNEYRLIIEKAFPLLEASVLKWNISARHDSGGEADWKVLAHGAFDLGTDGGTSGARSPWPPQ